jgi:O-methyltransferase
MQEYLRPAVRRIRARWEMLRLPPLAQAVIRERLTYLPPGKLARLERTVARVIAERVPGDVLEFGVALGGTAILLARHVAAANATADAGAARRCFHGFDVFGMIPPPTSDKDDAKSRARYEVIRSGGSVGIGGERYYGYREDLFDTVKASLARHGCPVDGTTVQLHKGLFEATWPTVPVRAVALAHLDCDWYDPVAFCLGAVADLMSPGGAILIDDYHDYGGARAAVDEFLSARGEFAFEPGANPVLWKRGRPGQGH